MNAARGAKRALALLLAAAAMLCLCGCLPDTQKYALIQATGGGVHLEYGQTRQDVEQLLGAGQASGQDGVLYADGTTVYYQNDKLVGLSLTSPVYEVVTGFSVGSTREKVLELFAKTDADLYGGRLFAFSKKGNHVAYETGQPLEEIDFDCAIAFHFSGDAVVKIEAMLRERFSRWSETQIRTERNPAMAIITAEIKLPEVQRTVRVHLYYPTDLPRDKCCTVNGVVTLLHGLGNTGDDWFHMTAACRYAADNGLVLVAPDADNGFYTDMAFGAPWETMLTQLLPDQLGCIFNLPMEREKNYLCGLSMGGYGALRLGLRHPERWAVVGSFSGALDIGGMAQVMVGDASLAPILTPVLGPELQVGADSDLFALARGVAALPGEQQPRFLCTCGRQDEDVAHIHTQNQNFQNAVQGLGLDMTYQEWDGVHEWNFWDRSLATFIGFALGNGYGECKREDWRTD